jgi:hypothetical protein
MNKFWQIVAVVVLILIAFTFYWTRYQIVPADYTYAPAFYKINRLSGQVTLTVGKEFVRVESIEAKRGADPGTDVAPAPEAQKPLPPQLPVPAPPPPENK